MADRRMFHNMVVSSDGFLDLPLGAQALYLHLTMAADDDGFVAGPRQILRMVGATEEDMQALIDRAFLLWFDGVGVIRHWRMANTLKSDRLRLPRYPEIAKGIYLDENKAYTQIHRRGRESLYTNKRKLLEQYGNQTESQKKREEKKREEKNRKENKREEREGKCPDPDGSDPEPAAPTHPPALCEDMSLRKMYGKLGKGVVLLTEREQEILLDRLGLDGFDYYVERLANFLLKTHATINNHYATILQWWQEDRGAIHE